MKTKREHFTKNIGEKGNALVYVLIAIALFGALSFTLARQSRDSGTSEIDEAKAQIYATELLTYSAQVRSVLDQMIYSGSNINDLDLTLPSEAGYSTAPYIHKVYHPQGGGLIQANIPTRAVSQISASPPAGWYLGRFNNVEWTATSGTDVILTAYQISRQVCEKINENLTGSTTIPALSGNMNLNLIDTGTNSDLDVAACAACDGHSTLCVSNSTVSAYSFYTIVAER